MTIDLNIYDRFMICVLILPEQGSIEEAITCHNLRAKLQLSEDEQEEYFEDLDDESFKVKDGPSQSYELSSEDVEVIRKGFKLLSARGGFRTEDKFVDLYQRFQEDN